MEPNAPSVGQGALCRVVILTEAGPDLGFGHLVRCVALYDALEHTGARCDLLVAGDAPAHVVADRRVKPCEWRTGSEVVPWLAEADCAVIDSYHATEEQYRVIASSVSVAAYFDDTSRLAYPPGIIINGMPEADTLGLSAGLGHTLLLGARHQVLRPEFWEPIHRPAKPLVERLLVIAGGTDASGARSCMAGAAREAFPHAEVDVVDSPREALPMRDAMAEADIAVSAAGQTLYELAALGTPAVAVCVADNQRAQAHALERAGTLLLAGVWGERDIGERISACLAELGSAQRRERMAASARGLIDGRGALRVARAIVRQVLVGRLEIRRAESRDEEDLLLLANDPLVRDMSFSTAVIDAGTHHQWLQRTLRDANKLLLVGSERGLLVGQVRFDLTPDAGAAESAATVSISVAPGYRGLGVAGILLERAIAVLGLEHPQVAALHACVREENVASRLLFESAGFTITDDSLSRGAGTCTQPGALTYRRELGEARTQG